MKIVVMLGGRVAEQVVFGEITSGAGDDLKQATQIARRMVCQWGMSDKVGLVVFRKGEPHPFLGRELTETKDYSEATAEVIDLEIRNILEDCRERAQQTLVENREKLNILAEELVEKETLNIGEIQDLLSLEEVKKQDALTLSLSRMVIPEAFRSCLNGRILFFRTDCLVFFYNNQIEVYGWREPYHSNPGEREESRDKYLETDSFLAKKQGKNL